MILDPILVSFMLFQAIKLHEMSNPTGIIDFRNLGSGAREAVGNALVVLVGSVLEKTKSSKVSVCSCSFLVYCCVSVVLCRARYVRGGFGGRKEGALANLALNVHSGLVL